MIDNYIFRSIFLLACVLIVPARADIIWQYEFRNEDSPDFAEIASGKFATEGNLEDLNSQQGLISFEFKYTVEFLIDGEYPILDRTDLQYQPLEGSKNCFGSIIWDSDNNKFYQSQIRGGVPFTWALNMVSGAGTLDHSKLDIRNSFQDYTLHDKDSSSLVISPLGGEVVEPNDQLSISIVEVEGNGFKLEFEGLLQVSSDLIDWTDVDPQPISPYIVVKENSSRYFRCVKIESDQ